MAKNDSDLLLEVFPGRALGDREIAWLWLSLEIKSGYGFEECALNSSTMRTQIAKALRGNPQVRNNLERYLDTELLPIASFNWVEENGRQSKWLVAQTMQKTGLRIRSSVFHTLTLKDQLITLFDLWDRAFGQKELTLRRLSEAWTQHLKSDRTFNWLNDEDEIAKCALAWTWLEKNKPMLTARAKPFVQRGELLEFFDSCNGSAEEKELWIEKIKRRWSTQKTREKAAEKKQYNFVLPLTVNAVLDRLAEKHQLSRTKVLEQLIVSEEQHELYLPGNSAYSGPS